MAEIIEFTNGEFSREFKEKLVDEFEIIEGKLEEFTNNYNHVFDSKTRQLLTNFSDIKHKVEAGTFLSNKQSKLFLDSYKKVTNSDDNFLECYITLEYINLINLFKNQILTRNNSFIRDLIIGLGTNEDASLDKYKRIIPVLLNKKIEELLNEESIFSKKDIIVDFIDQAIDGYSAIEIKKMDENKEDKDSLDNGIITIDRIHNYYVKQLENINSLLGYDLVETKYIYKIKNIKSFDEKNQLMFINIIQELQTFKYSVVDQLKVVSLLYLIFLSLNKKRINNISKEDIINILFYSYNNEDIIDETIDKIYNGI